MSHLSWSEVKRLLREDLCPVLLERGFVNPGVAMWRFRDCFVDVVEFRASWGDRMQAVFGCMPRLGSTQPRAWDCPFNTQPTSGLGVDPSLLAFAGDEATQRQRLAILAPQIGEASDKWFAHFASVHSARHALAHNSTSGPDHVSSSKPGSLAQTEVLDALAALEAKDV